MCSIRFRVLARLLAAVALVTGCAGVPLYPSRPESSEGVPVADPLPSKVVLHLSATQAGLLAALERHVPVQGEGMWEFRGERPYTWSRTPFSLRFGTGRVELKSELSVRSSLPLLGTQALTFELAVSGEPVVTPDWKARLQGARAEVTTRDLKLRALENMAGITRVVETTLERSIEELAYDLTPLITEAYTRVATPIPLPVGEATGCVGMKVTAIEAGPTVLAGGLEKDLALVVQPSVTFPCAAPPVSPSPPRLSNVATLVPGPFTVTVPIAAEYRELARAMVQTFEDGRLYFSKDYPDLYLSRPELYAARTGELVLKLHLEGPVKTGVVSAKLDGELYFTGRPQVVDNELTVPDLEPTIETRNFLLALKATFDHGSIRDQARQALRLDLSARFAPLRARLSTDFAIAGDLGCLSADVARVEVVGVYPHASYLRIYVALTAQADVQLPCPVAPAPPPVSAR